MSIFFNNLIAILVLVIITSNPVMAEAPTQTVTSKVLTVKETIAYYAELHNTSYTEISKVAYCESSHNPKAKGDGGRAFGVMQYHRPTFERFSRLKGEQLDYYSYTDQIKLTAWIWANYPQYKSHWTCAKIVGII